MQLGWQGSPGGTFPGPDVAESGPSFSFPKAGNWTEMVGQTPWSARVPLDPPVANEDASAADTAPRSHGSDHTLNANCAKSGKLSSIAHSLRVVVVP
jgi:hypothetical protein